MTTLIGKFEAGIGEMGHHCQMIQVWPKYEPEFHHICVRVYHSNVFLSLEYYLLSIYFLCG